MKSIGNQLKKVRLERGLSQREVAEALGVEQNYISRYESGQRQMDIQTLEALANILNVRFVQRFEYDVDEEMADCSPRINPGGSYYTIRT